jgi:hypothetical protein
MAGRLILISAGANAFGLLAPRLQFSRSAFSPRGLRPLPYLRAQKAGEPPFAGMCYCPKPFSASAKPLSETGMPMPASSVW